MNICKFPEFLHYMLDYNVNNIKVIPFFVGKVWLDENEMKLKFPEKKRTVLKAIEKRGHSFFFSAHFFHRKYFLLRN